jgi:16S rRNA (guanine1516-N2)-methyltransferase
VLVDGVRRAATRFDIDGRVRCVEGDALDALRRGECFDVVYLDPMFPVRRKGALPRLKAQLLADVALPLEIDEATLVDVARIRARERVVLKRRGRDPSVAVPDWQIRGTRVRFDVYRGRG